MNVLIVEKEFSSNKIETLENKIILLLILSIVFLTESFLIEKLYYIKLHSKSFFLIRLFIFTFKIKIIIHYTIKKQKGERKWSTNYMWTIFLKYLMSQNYYFFFLIVR